jgi:hypothetical protein
MCFLLLFEVMYNLMRDMGIQNEVAVAYLGYHPACSHKGTEQTYKILSPNVGYVQDLKRIRDGSGVGD